MICELDLNAVKDLVDSGGHGVTPDLRLPAALLCVSLDVRPSSDCMV